MSARVFPAYGLRGVALAGLLLLAACGQPDEPSALVMPTPRFTSVPDVGYPLEAPDMALGARVFAGKCTACHGERGLADGPMVRAGAAPTPPKLAEMETSWDKTPQERFAFIAAGKIERMMPPWKDALPEAERWAVTYFTYTLHYTPERLAEGRAVWETACADCHGQSGRGDGPKAADINRPVGDLTDPVEMMTLSDKALYTIITEGVGDSMPAFLDDLTDDQHRAVVAYTRALGLVNPDAIGRPLPLDPTPAPTAAK